MTVSYLLLSRVSHLSSVNAPLLSFLASRDTVKFVDVFMASILYMSPENSRIWMISVPADRHQSPQTDLFANLVQRGDAILRIALEIVVHEEVELGEIDVSGKLSPWR